jgi:hypothetical protein
MLGLLGDALVEASENKTRPQGPQNQLTADELANGWLLLFDGETLFGWKASSEVDWRVADGTIEAVQGDVGLLHTTTQFSDFELRCDFKAGPATNSGIFLRTSPKPPGPTSGCYELNIASSEQSPFPTGSLVGRKQGKFSLADNRWHTYHIVATGGHFSVLLDGKPVLDWKDPQPLGRGYIGLQKNEGAVAFRNIKLRPLGLAPLFNGKDLTGWRTFPGKESRFSVTPAGDLQILSGPGQLETEATFGDFVLQTEIFVDGDTLNSGIFFRSIPGDFSNGYESQIHNGFEKGDRSRPSNAGTGAIFRRQTARRVLADDRMWFTKTIICAGPHMAVWVNGFQVTDWTDRRSPDPNPRRGRRLEAGTIILQGHDPTTNLRFRNMRVGEMKSRR